MRPITIPKNELIEIGYFLPPKDYEEVVQKMRGEGSCRVVMYKKDMMFMWEYRLYLAKVGRTIELYRYKGDINCVKDTIAKLVDCKNVEEVLERITDLLEEYPDHQRVYSRKTPKT